MSGDAGGAREAAGPAGQKARAEQAVLAAPQGGPTAPCQVAGNQCQEQQAVQNEEEDELAAGTRVNGPVKEYGCLQ